MVVWSTVPIMVVCTFLEQYNIILVVICSSIFVTTCASCASVITLFSCCYHLCSECYVMLSVLFAMSCSFFVFSFANCFEMPCLKSKVYRKQPLYLHEIKINYADTLLPPNPTYKITLHLLFLLYCFLYYI